jgi:hypothetical protein
MFRNEVVAPSRNFETNCSDAEVPVGKVFGVVGREPEGLALAAGSNLKRVRRVGLDPSSRLKPSPSPWAFTNSQKDTGAFIETSCRFIRSRALHTQISLTHPSLSSHEFVSS